MYINVLNVTGDGNIEIEYDEEAMKILIELAINYILKEAIKKQESEGVIS